MRIGSLFAGIGGFDLAARWMGWETAWYSEIDPYACAVMAKHFPEALNHGDITTFDGRQVGPVDLLCGGFPCQDISVAGKGAGLSGARSGLWSHYSRVIGEVRPRWVVIENSPRLRSLGLDRILGELAAFGYDAEWHCIPAASVGAPHRRDRVWIVAHAQREQLRGQSGRRGGADRNDPPQSAVDGATQSLADADGQRELQPEGGQSVVGRRTGNGSRESGLADTLRERLEGQRAITSGVSAQFHDARVVGRWPAEPNVGRVAHGVPSRVDRLKCLGNAVVPQVAYEIFQAIASAP